MNYVAKTLTKTIDDKVYIMHHNERAHAQGDLKEDMAPTPSIRKGKEG